MKAVNYKKIKYDCFFFQRKPLRLAYNKNMSYVYKKNVKYDKNQKLIYFVWKTRVEVSKIITNHLKTLGFMTPIPFDAFPWHH